MSNPRDLDRKRSPSAPLGPCDDPRRLKAVWPTLSATPARNFVDFATNAPIGARAPQEVLRGPRRSKRRFSMRRDNRVSTATGEEVALKAPIV